jgi:hypothetical protein
MPKIDQLFAFICEEAPEDEGVMGMQMSDGSWMPFVGADMKRVESLVPHADQISILANKPYKIVKFKIDQIIEKPVPKKPDREEN